ncbi:MULTISPECIES: magnesium transporter MgtE N-terminal domain-containing protein [Wolbachia]|uniref:MgtE intracellular N domain protein n=1 Tax=Wolbachia pipientis TaxID=955 RepID=A0A7G5CDU5_WOLPI|nr:MULTISPECIES: MgtE intracellular N domain protein [Wolbachia]MDE5061324.1 MgtE intracellular N domain protein [Wolbachia endosymbiont of Drosophila nikananu]QMV47379.1 MgtE intracellular N domain protein [Wolbachia pipientis]
MSGKKHVFKMVPGKKLLNATKWKILQDQVDNNKMPEDQVDSKGLTWNKLAKVGFIPLDDESDIALDLPIKFCGPKGSARLVSCVQEGEKDLAGEIYYCDNNQDLLTNCKVSIGKNLRHVELDYVNNPYSFAYINDQLMKLSLTKQAIETFSADIKSSRIFLDVQPVEYQYVTWEESNNDKYYFSDDQGNIIDSLDNKALQYIKLYSKEQTIKDIISSNILEDINTFTKVLVESLTDEQLKIFANTLSNEQLRALVDHLTNHQLQALAQELNPEKLKIVVPILNDAQLEALVRDLNPEQVKEILPHLKTDQFKALIKTLSDEQFTVLAKDLAEHHLTILSKELGGNQLKALVNNLQEDQLKDLVNKLDHKKLEAIAQDLTDPNRIQTIIKSLADNPGKLQAFARNLSNEQFKALLDNIDANELKDIIHKLPYEKVTAVIGDLSNQDQSKAIIDALKGKLEEQNEKLKEVYEKLEELLPPPVYSEVLESLRSSPRIFQDTNIEFIAVEEYAYHESEYL